MIDELAASTTRAAAFRRWLATRVQFCSSLVDRIATGMPPAAERSALEAQLGYTDALLTVTEPYSFWAIEGDGAALRVAFPIDGDAESVVFAPDIGVYQERKLRLLNAPHTATTPVALLAGIRTVREGVAHARVGAFLRRILFDEIIPATNLPADTATPYAAAVVERFRNPWLDHEWRTIATNQEVKFRIRVVPLIGEYMKRRGRVPDGLALAAAAHLAFLQQPVEALGDAARLPDFVSTVERWKAVIARDGVEGALAHD